MTAAFDPASVERVAEVVARILGDTVAAMYLFGSALNGGWRAHSDIDLLVLAHRELRDGDARALGIALAQVSGPQATGGPARPAEVTVVCLGDLRPWRPPVRRVFQYGEWLREAALAGRLEGPVRDPDLTLLLATAQQAHHPLAGPVLDAFLEPLPTADIRRAILECLPSVRAGLAGDERNVLLTLARMWRTLEDGAIVAKDEAADWAIARLPDAIAEPLKAARDAYRGLREDNGSAREDCRVTADRLAALIAASGPERDSSLTHLGLSSPSDCTD